MVIPMSDNFADINYKSRQANTDVIVRMVKDLAECNCINVGQISDRYHTFDELYRHRAKLFAALVVAYPDISWKSKLHHDGTMYDNMFIVGMDLPQGKITYHQDMYEWDMFHCKELDRAPEHDGHTPNDVLFRLSAMIDANMPSKNELNMTAATYNSFGAAMEMAKSGKIVTRRAWCHTNSFKYVAYQKGYPEGVACNKQTSETWGIAEGCKIYVEPYLQLYDMHIDHCTDIFRVYTPTFEDIFADDWTTVG